MNLSTSVPPRRVFHRLSIVAGNAIQIAGIVAAIVCLWQARSVHLRLVAFLLLIAAWTLLYFFCHGIAHWVVGRMVGIRFAFYTVGGPGNPGGYPTSLRWVFERLPFFGVQTEKASMQRARPIAKAIMWTAGVISSMLVPTLGAIYAWQVNVYGSRLFLIFAVFWAVGVLSSNWRSAGGDFAKARRVLSAS